MQIIVKINAEQQDYTINGETFSIITLGNTKYIPLTDLEILLNTSNLANSFSNSRLVYKIGIDLERLVYNARTNYTLVQLSAVIDFLKGSSLPYSMRLLNYLTENITDKSLIPIEKYGTVWFPLKDVEEKYKVDLSSIVLLPKNCVLLIDGIEAVNLDGLQRIVEYVKSRELERVEHYKNLTSLDKIMSVNIDKLMSVEDSGFEIKPINSQFTINSDVPTFSAQADRQLDSFVTQTNTTTSKQSATQTAATQTDTNSSATQTDTNSSATQTDKQTFSAQTDKVGIKCTPFFTGNPINSSMNNGFTHETSNYTFSTQSPKKFYFSTQLSKPYYFSTQSPMPLTTCTPQTDEDTDFVTLEDIAEERNFKLEELYRWLSYKGLLYRSVRGYWFPTDNAIKLKAVKPVVQATYKWSKSYIDNLISQLDVDTFTGEWKIANGFLNS